MSGNGCMACSKTWSPRVDTCKAQAVLSLARPGMVVDWESNGLEKGCMLRAVSQCLASFCRPSSLQLTCRERDVYVTADLVNLGVRTFLPLLPPETAWATSVTGGSKHDNAKPTW